jgi:hypothetical protein
MTKLAICLAGVLGKRRIDESVMATVRSVALDTSRGPTFEMCSRMAFKGREGEHRSVLATLSNQTDDQVRKLLRFLRAIRVAEVFDFKGGSGLSKQQKWRLTPSMTELWGRVMNQ